METNKPFWKRYYYGYLERFLDFLVVPGTRIFRATPEEAALQHRIIFSGNQCEYIVASDVLGHLDDVQEFLRQSKNSLAPEGRLVITQYSALWEPVLRIATRLGLRKAVIEQNWLTGQDLHNFCHLAGLEVVKAGSKMIMPLYIPLVSWVLNALVANVWPFTRMGIFHYIVARKPERRMNSVPGISIIVPARNEAGTIEKIVRELPDLGSGSEIILIEGNSTDDTYEEIKRAAAKYKATKNIIIAKQDGKGKGDAVRKGFDMATKEILSIYDADMTVPPEEMKKFYAAIVENKGDFINGSRLVYPLEKDSMRVLNFFANKFFSLAFSYILGQPLKDTLCGTKVIWRSDYERLKKGRSYFGDFDPFGDFDLLFGAAKLNLKIIDLPIHYKERVYGSTNISRWKHGWLLLKMTIFAARKLRLF